MINFTTTHATADNDQKPPLPELTEQDESESEEADPYEVDQLELEKEERAREMLSAHLKLRATGTTRGMGYLNSTTKIADSYLQSTLKIKDPVLRLKLIRQALPESYHATDIEEAVKETMQKPSVYKTVSNAAKMAKGFYLRHRQYADPAAAALGTAGFIARLAGRKSRWWRAVGDLSMVAGAAVYLYDKLVPQYASPIDG